jgi:hypothetical protein
MTLTPTNTFLVTATSQGTSLVSPSFTPATGDIIVVKAAGEDSTLHLNTPTNSANTITWTLQQSDTTSSHCSAYMWTGAVTAGGSACTVTVSTVAGGAAQFHSMMVERWDGTTCQLAGSPALNKKVSTGTATSSLTTTAAGSVISWMDADWAANSPTSATYSNSSNNTSEGIDNRSTNNYVAYYDYLQAPTAGATTYGVTAPTGQTYSLLAIEIQAVSSGGTNYTANPSDSEGITDSASFVQNQFLTPSDPEGLTDSVSPVQAMVRSAADPENITDSAAVVQNQFLSPSDPVGLTDAASFVQNQNPAPSDPVGLTDSASFVQQQQEAPADPVGLTDSVTVVQSQQVTVSDPIGITDSESQGAFLSSNPADPVGITDSAGIVQSQQATPSDPVGVTDAASFVQAQQQAPADAVGITDSATAQLNGGGTNYTASPADPEGITDVASVVQAQQMSSADSVGLTDAATSGLSAVRAASDPVGLTDSASGSLGYIRTPPDPIGLADAISTVLNAQQGPSDPLGLTDSVSLTQTVQRSLSDAVGLTDSVQAMISAAMGTHLDLTVRLLQPRWQAAVPDRPRWFSSLRLPRWKAAIMGPITMPAATAEYLPISVTKNGPRSAISISSGCQYSIVAGVATTPGTWTACTVVDGNPAAWIGSLSPGTYTVFIQVTASPEVIVRNLGQITLT